MKEVSQGDFEQHLETNSHIAEVGESYQSFNVMTKELRATEVLQMDFVSNVSKDVYKRQVHNKSLLLC